MDFKVKFEQLRSKGVTVLVKRQGKFGIETLYPLKSLPLVSKKETEKAYCCGDYTGFTYKDGNPQIHIFGWIAKSMVVNVEGVEFVPMWILDKWNVSEIGSNSLTHSYVNQYCSIYDLTSEKKNWITCRSEREAEEKKEAEESSWTQEDEKRWIEYKNEFAQLEAEQEARAFLSDPDYQRSLKRA